MTTNTYLTTPAIPRAAAGAPAGTVTIPYPTGTTQALFTGSQAGLATDNVVYVNNNDAYRGSAVTIAYGASTITITNNSTSTWPAGATIRVGLALGNLANLRGTEGPGLTDNSGGTASNTIAAISDTATKNAIASIVAVLKAAGVTL